MTRTRFLTLALLILVLAAGLRAVWLTSDAPNVRENGVGIVWHDEGPWVHNARNRALWGVWRTDEWNPMFLTPVFTGLEYGSFRLFGVGTWQARVVPAVSGLAAVAFLMAGLAAIRGRAAALTGGFLLATNYVSVMWNRAALMESTLTAFLVISWACYALAPRRAWWGAAAGVAAVLAFFTKASAAFFIGALGLEAVGAVVVGFWGSGVPRFWGSESDDARAGAWWTLAGLGVAALAIGACFALPHWSEFRFYNWQMSVTRKPEYTSSALAMRASWLPLVHDFFTWMWPIFAAACAGMIGAVLRWRTTASAERLLTWWILLGLAELVVHDSGNERRYVMLLPALIALAALVLTRPRARAVAAAIAPVPRFLAAGLTLGLGYLVAGSAIRVAWLEQVRGGHLHNAVVTAMAMAAVAAIAVVAAWRRIGPWLARPRVPALLAVALVLGTAAFDLQRFASWAVHRQSTNYDASRELGRRLPPGTLVQGKLANGLALENRIRPLFIGHDFGNYADRLRRDDARYILTYVSPSVGFESQAGSGLIQEILDRYPQHRAVATFAVNETGGPDRAALIDKFPEP